MRLELSAKVRTYYFPTRPGIEFTNRPFSYSEKESQSNDTLLHFVDFSNVHNCDKSSNATRSNLVNNMYKNNARSRLFC